MMEPSAFVYKCVCESFAYLLRVVFVCNNLFLNDFNIGVLVV